MRPVAGILALTLSACAATPPVATNAAPQGPGKQYQWLLGSGEAAAISAGVHSAMAVYAIAHTTGPVTSAVLASGAKLSTPRWADCDAKARAVVYDIDETVLLNTGANYDTARRGDPPFDAGRWAEWERTGANRVEAVPGVVDAIRAIRGAGITVIFNSNRDRAQSAQTAEALASVGIDGAVPGQTLFLKGDVAPGSAKDPRRTAISTRYCVIAMGGDNLGDFADAFNDKALTVAARRALALDPGIRTRWGAGWFLIPNPMYGAWDGAGYDDLFPAEKRWTPKEND